MIQIPRRSIVDAKVALYLLRAGSFFRVAHERDSLEPFRQRKMRITEQRGSRGAELVGAVRIQALIQMPRRNLRRDRLALAVNSLSAGFVGDELGDFFAVTLETADALWPSRGFQVGLALLFGAKSTLDLYDALTDSVILPWHDSSMRQLFYFVNCIITRNRGWIPVRATCQV